FYVSGRPPTFGTPGVRLQVQQVLPNSVGGNGPVRVLIDAQGNTTIPATVVAEIGLSNFNYIVFVAHSPTQVRVVLKNVDGTFPKDPRNPSNITDADTAFLGTWYRPTKDYIAQ
ncbi:MAG: hypothetical protein WCG27_12615, partial [Pseudomonadota bacterium]